MIKNIELKFGSSAEKPNLNIGVTPITVFVGPNNSGKSKILKELEHYCMYGDDQSWRRFLLNDINFNSIENPEIEITKSSIIPKNNENIPEGSILINPNGNINSTATIKIDSFLRFLKNPESAKNNFCTYFLAKHTLRIGAGNRISLINQLPSGDLLKSTENTFQYLFKNDLKRDEVRRIVYDAFKRYFVLDPFNLGHLRIRLSELPPTPKLEQSLGSDAREFHAKALLIDEFSDGVKAFIGIMVNVIGGDPYVTLLDEPEAFLHPSLAFKLGKEMSLSVNGTDKNIFVSTHSSNFLMGCIQSGVPINIVRLTYSNNVSTARTLASEDILKMMRHPLLRSTGVLNGLFYEYIIVTEGDTDRAFYQEINERLGDDGIPNCLFLNAQNKQTIHEIIRPLRKMGIPCAGIVDVDVIKDGGKNWSNLLSSASISKMTIDSLANQRANIKNAFETANTKFKTSGGISVLNGEEKQSCTDLFDTLDSYGIFVIRGGEIESWLKKLGVPSGHHGTEWLIEIFEKMGEDPASPDYVIPESGDVWDFIKKIKTWFSNPNRKGIPE